MHVKETLLFLMLVITSFAIPYGLYSLGFFNSSGEYMVKVDDIIDTEVGFHKPHYTVRADDYLIPLSIVVSNTTSTTTNYIEQETNLGRLIPYLNAKNKPDYGTRCYLKINYQPKESKLFWVKIIPIILSIGVTVKNKEEEFKNGSMREMIYQTIKSDPGIHFRELCRELNKKNGVIQYHLQVLEVKEKRIISHQDGGKFTRYFVINGLLDSNDKHYCKLISMLHRSSMYVIIELLRNSGSGLSRNQLAKEIGISVQGISCNCKKLVDYNIIEEYYEGRQKFYRLSNETNKTLESLEKTHY